MIYLTDTHLEILRMLASGNQLARSFFSLHYRWRNAPDIDEHTDRRVIDELKAWGYVAEFDDTVHTYYTMFITEMGRKALASCR